MEVFMKKPRNFCAKHAAKFCRHQVHRNKKHDYKRKPKHPKRGFSDFGFFNGLYNLAFSEI